ncbi:MAG: energy-coupling factor transporter transmembrane protein EcfT [Coriobacteriia bacterium]|nr:energy-coupling factor transporter transmembrane protein EcfT [Coriobacteriia bacterium]
MDIGAIDRSATTGAGWLHGVSPISKLVAFALVLAAIIVSWNVFALCALLLALVACVVSAGVRLRVAFTLAAYPGLFAVIFALASAPDFLTGVVIVMKALSAGLAAVTVVMTTPYPQIFAPVQRVVPGIVGDALLMTYRAMFLLLGKFDSLLRAVRLRSGVRGTHPVQAARSSVRALGGLMLYSFDLAQRDYDIMRLRGYSGRLRATLPRSRNRRRDAALLAAALLMLATAIAWRFGTPTLSAYSWLLPIPALALLAAAPLARRRI